jgi:predicted AAA+ superfamily ATPase
MFYLIWCCAQVGVLCWFNFCYAIRKPAVVMIVGVNGGGKTTSLGKTREYGGYELLSFNFISSDEKYFSRRFLIKGISSLKLEERIRLYILDPIQCLALRALQSYVQLSNQSKLSGPWLGLHSYIF